MADVGILIVNTITRHLSRKDHLKHGLNHSRGIRKQGKVKDPPDKVVKPLHSNGTKENVS